MKIAVAGAGFVGIVHAATMASQDHSVVLYDIDQKRIDHINDFAQGKREDLPIHEAGLPAMIKEGFQKGHLTLTTNQKQAIEQSDIIFICVGTPPDENGKSDLKYVDSVAHAIGQAMQQNPQYKIIVNKSTVPVGTARRVEKIIEEYYTGDFDVVSNPETLAEGRAVRDATMPKRIIVGVNSARAKKVMTQIYAPFFLTQQEKIYFMSPESAELTKYACNTYLASQVVLTNIFANIAAKTGANWRDMVPAILSDVRIGKFVHPGLGFGGSCFRKDMAQLIHTIKDTKNNPIDSIVLTNILEQNEKQKLCLDNSIKELFGENLTSVTLAIWGLSFKKETNDVRDAASLAMIPKLLEKGATLRIHDPKAIEEFKKEMQKQNISLHNVSFYTDKYETVKGADGLLILNDWKTYRQPDLNALREKMKRKIILDGKDLLNYKQIVEDNDFTYAGVGRPKFIPKKQDYADIVTYSQLIEEFEVIE